jgi:actin-related protein
MIPTPVLSLFSVGLTTGVVVESGDGITWVCPILSGEIVDQSVQKLTLAGTDVNQHLKNLLMREGINIESSAVDEIIKDIKEKNCFFALDPEHPPKLDESFSFTMPDGSNINIPNYIFHEAPEVLFKPNLLGYNILNIPQAIVNSLQGIDKYYWSDLLSHIMISGGNLSYSGFEERLRLELTQLIPELGKIPKPKVVKPSREGKQKMKLKEKSKKNEDTCPHCGMLVDLTDGKEFCPSCNGRIVLPELSIGNVKMVKNPKLEKGKVICPDCKKEVEDKASIFCPYCGGTFQTTEIHEVPPEIIKNTLPAREFSGFYESSEEVLRFFVPEHLQFAIFNGASILGSLPSFQSLFVTHEQFQSNTAALYKNISEIF